MDQAGSDYVLAGRVVHTGLIVLTHAVDECLANFLELRHRELRRISLPRTPLNKCLPVHLSTCLPLLVTTNITHLGDVPMRTIPYTTFVVGARGREGQA